MGFEDENALKIDDYLQQAKNTAYTNKTYEIDWGNKKEVYDILRIPLELLTYSFDNARVLSQLKREERKSGYFDFEIEDDRIKYAKKFENWLNKKYVTELRTDIERIGQKDPGIITHGGVIIDGNRRFMVLKNISKSVTSEKIPNVDVGFLHVIRLNPGIPHKKLIELQTRIQMAKKIFEPYSPINSLLAIQKLRDNGFSIDEISNFLHLPKKEVGNKIDQIHLIDAFLEYADHKNEYELIESEKLTPDHFGELRRMEESLQDIASLNPNQIVEYKQLMRNVAFKLLENNIDPDMIKLGLTLGSRERIRPLKDVILDQRTHERLKELLKLGKSKQDKKEVFEAMQAQFFIVQDRKSSYTVINIANQILKKIEDIDYALMDPHQEYDLKQLLSLIINAGRNLVTLKKKIEEKSKT